MSVIMREPARQPPNRPAMKRIHIIFLAIALLPACAAVQDSKMSISEEKALFYYERAVRWGDYAAADRLRRIEGDDYPRNGPNKLKRIKVTAYDILNRTASDDGTTLRLAVRISYYDEDVMKVHSVMDNQVWRYDAEQDSWYITSPLPLFE